MFKVSNGLVTVAHKESMMLKVWQFLAKVTELREVLFDQRMYFVLFLIPY